MRSTKLFALSSLVVMTVAAIAACGGSQPPSTPSPEGSATPPSSAAPASSGSAAAAPSASASALPTASATPTAEAPRFSALPKDKKAEIMMTQVVPKVGKVFKEHDAKKYEKFGCATCHGPQKKEDPHKVLPKLTFSNGGYEKLAKAKPEMMKFMGEKVLPEMAAALGEKPFDPATKQGFGCMGCHTVD